MKTFFYVLQKCIKSKKIVYPDDPFDMNIYNVSNVDDMYQDVSFYIYMLIYDIYYRLKDSLLKDSLILNIYLKYARVKLSCLNKILNNIFISNELKEKIIDIFSRAQRIYFALVKFTNVYKYKKYPRVVTNDLTLNPLDINHSSTFIMLQNKSTYLFSINDLINIIETAICNAPHFFLEPLSPKNPYNNQKLNTSTLCNIYFKMKNIKCKFSLILHLFFLDCFVKNNFIVNNESFLREYAIKKFVYTSPSQILYKPVINMLKQNYYTNKLHIHNDFPNDLLVDIFKPYLVYYYTINYNINTTQKNSNNKEELFKKLKKFYEYNELFGRKIYKAGSINFFKKITFEFNTKHINFYDMIQEQNHNNFDLNELFHNYYPNSEINEYDSDY
jgi:hypothetical protein